MFSLQQPSDFYFHQVKSLRIQMSPSIIGILSESEMYFGTFSTVVLQRRTRKPIILHTVTLPVSTYCLN